MALDMATLTGWAVGGGQMSWFHGVKSLAPSGKTAHPGARYQRLWNLMVDLKRQFPVISLVAFELPIGESTSQIQKAYSHGYIAIVHMFCADNALPYRGVHVGTLKKFMTGRGNAQKDEMIAAVKARGFVPADDNEADAIAIGLWATQC